MSVNCSEHAVQVLVQCTRDDFQPVSCQIHIKIKTWFFVFFFLINALAKKKRKITDSDVGVLQLVLEIKTNF